MSGVAESAVQIAAQTGRLDLLTGILAVLVIILGLGAFPIWFFVQHRAATVARAEAQQAVKDVIARAEAEAIEKVEQMLPTLFEDYRAFIQGAATTEVADEIAQAQEEPE